MRAQSASPRTVTIHVPIKFNRRGGRKTVISEFLAPAPRPRTDNALLKALARAYRWRRQIENGEYQSITELAKVERVNESYACRLLRLTLLAPALVTDTVNGRQNPDLMLKQLMRPLPAEWTRQLALLKFGDEPSDA